MEEKQEEKVKYDLDLSTDEGREETKKIIKESLDKFDEEGKDFLGKLLFIMLDAITDQQLQIEKVEEKCKNSFLTLRDGGYLHRHMIKNDKNE